MNYSNSKMLRSMKQPVFVGFSVYQLFSPPFLYLRFLLVRTDPSSLSFSSTEVPHIQSHSRPQTFLAPLLSRNLPLLTPPLHFPKPHTAEEGVVSSHIGARALTLFSCHIDENNKLFREASRDQRILCASVFLRLQEKSDLI